MDRDERDQAEVPALADKGQALEDAFRAELEDAGLVLTAEWWEVFECFTRAMQATGIGEIPVRDRA